MSKMVTQEVQLAHHEQGAPQTAILHLHKDHYTCSPLEKVRKVSQQVTPLVPKVSTTYRQAGHIREHILLGHLHVLHDDHTSRRSS